MPEIFKKVCSKCGCSYMQKRPSAPDTDWVCAKCGEPVNLEAAQHRMHLTAFGVFLSAKLPLMKVSLPTSRLAKTAAGNTNRSADSLNRKQR